MELVLRLLTGSEFFNIGLAFITLFSVSAGLLLYGACSFMSARAAKITSGTFMIVFGVFYATQIIYHSVFNNFLIIYSLKAGGTDQIITDGMLDNTIKAITSGIPAILLLSVPAVVIFTPLGRFLKYKKIGTLKSVLSLIISVIVYLVSVLAIALHPTLASVQSGLFDTNISMNRFGLIHTEALDIGYNIFGIEQELELEEETPDPEPESDPEPEETPVVYTPNVMNIDFESLKETETDKDLKLMNEYFSAKEPTYTNEYTGMYKGYNLVMVVAEGFSPYAIDPVLTPTLYKMSQEGFKFNNFYTPVWGVSTSDGEYTACTGLIPKAGVWSFYRSHKNYMPFCLGNMFKSIGVTNTYAYHNNTASYYHRDLSHPNMGYNYKGMGTGVEKYVDKVWPQSDYQMVAGSIDEYLKTDEQFHAYYMTVSGHLHYTKTGNYQAGKHWDKVKDLECSSTLKAYYACNIELDLAMEELLKRLNEAGVADKTVIAITPDHYPYGLEKDDGNKYEIWEELLGHSVETQFELYESTFLLYCQSTQNAPVVEKYCYSVDILPTLLNLFGFEYDSRLLMGSDIFSTAEDLVIFNNRSYITDKGKYNAKTGVFTPHGENTFSSDEEMSEYVKNISAVVNNKFKMSTKILEKDYYRYLFGKDE
ncbi:MAG: sulfatase-like hydrolase/transferase [Clostridia bacterium]|nr:sulfatase-like hydrolase/transferase [Clostridia bacterium]